MTFRKLTVDYLRKVRPVLQSQLPLSSQILNIIDLRLKGNFLKNTYQTEFYGIPETEIINVTLTPSTTIAKVAAATSVTYIPSHLSDDSSVVQAYKNLVDWDNPHDFESIPSHFIPHFEKIIEEKGGSVKDKLPLVFLFLPIDVARKLDTKRFQERVRGKFEMANLSGEQSEKIIFHWKYGYPGSEAFVTEIMNTFACSKGVFKKGLRSSDGLVSWGMLLPIGTLGSLFTIDEVRGNGLARWTFEECCRSMAVDHGLIPACEVEHDNEASRNLMSKIGFKYITDLCYFKYFPPGKR